jgi:hypothetical protein
MGLTAGLAAGNTAKACSYFLPSQQAECRQVFAKIHATGSVSLGKTVIKGNKALVVMMSPRYCVSGSCVHNSDPTKDLPSGRTTFAKAFNASQSNQANPVTACERVHGRWYVDA